MRFKIKIRYIVLSAVNAAALISAAVITAVGGSMASSQQYNYAWQRWGGDGDFVQVSTFFSDDAGMNVNGVRSARSSLLNSLRSASVMIGDKKKMIPDAYSAPMGRYEVSCDINGHSEAEITAVGGSFFTFRSLRLTDGAFFSEEDLMQDGAVIDRDLAWRLYGSESISGKNIYINGIKLYISGVVDTPQTEAEKDAYGDAPRAYVSYSSAERIADAAQSGMNAQADAPVPDTEAEGTASRFSKVTCYECIIPEPVEDIGYNAVKNVFSDQYKNKLDIVNNTARFDPKKRERAYDDLVQAVVRNDAVVYPYWENASRIVEYKLSGIYHVRKMLLFIPLLTVLWLIFRLYRAYRSKKPIIKKKLSDAFVHCYEKVRACVTEKIRRNKNT